MRSLGAALIGIGGLLLVQLLSSPPAVPAASPDSLIPLTPAFYGSPERTVRIAGVGDARVVEPATWPAPLAVLLHPAGGLDALAGFQALLERDGIASAALPVPTDSAAAVGLDRWVAAEAARRRLPIQVVVGSEAWPHWLASQRGPPTAGVVLLGAPPRNGLIAGALQRLPARLRPAPDTLDPRTAGWSELTVVTTDSTTPAGRALARAARIGREVVLAGEPAWPPSPHPDPMRWRAVLDVLHGGVLVQTEVRGER